MFLTSADVDTTAQGIVVLADTARVVDGECGGAEVRRYENSCRRTCQNHAHLASIAIHQHGTADSNVAIAEACQHSLAYGQLTPRQRIDDDVATV